MNAIYTAYYDLVGMTGLLSIKKEDNKKFHAVHIYPLFRDICLMIYQINKELLDNAIDLNPDIKKIRHRVKLYQKRNNFKVYERIIDMHIDKFGNDIDNLGFYLEGKQLVGSTIYSTYIFQNTEFFSNDIKQPNESIFRFSQLIGETVVLIIGKLREKSNYSLPEFKIQNFIYIENTPYINKDLLKSSFFADESQQNVLLTRLIISLQEATTCKWLYDGIKESNELGIHNYILLRLLSIKTDEVMDNLKNMQKFLKNDFDKLDEDSNYEVSKLIKKFNENLKNECSILRNMIHYDIQGENFLDYVRNKMQADSTYINSISKELVKEYMSPLSKLISNYLNINNKKSMSDFEKILRRLKSLILIKEN